MTKVALLLLAFAACAYAFPTSSVDQSGIAVVGELGAIVPRPVRAADPGHHHHHHHGHHHHGYGGYNQGGYGGYGDYGYGGYGNGGYGDYGYNNGYNGGYGHRNQGNSYSQASANSAAINTPLGGFSVSSANANSGSESGYGGFF